MKKLFLFIAIAMCAIVSTFAQGPFKYQAIIRDNSGTVLPNKNVGLRISILQGSTPTMVYREEHNKTSDEFGVINVEVGTGNVLNGNFLTLNWGLGNYQLQVEIDMNGGTTYVALGISPILSVPLSNYATKAGMATFPAGLIMPFGGTVDKIPVGWLQCDGSAVSRTQYADLFAAISNNWGAGDYSTTFNLPDLRGQFLRGLDGTAGIDPDKTTRTAKYGGGNIGNLVGSYQNDINKAHNHSADIGYSGTLSMSGTTSPIGDHVHAIPTNNANGVPSVNTGNENGITSVPSGAAGAHSHEVTVTGGSHYHDAYIYENGGYETRAKNAYVLYIIKY